jgi:hypothetical protein
MTEDRMALIEAIQKADDGNFLRALAETVLQIIRTPMSKHWSVPAGTNARTGG